jgi:hypothetical protein
MELRPFFRMANQRRRNTPGDQRRRMRTKRELPIDVKRRTCQQMLSTIRNVPIEATIRNGCKSHFSRASGLISKELGALLASE